MKCVNCETGSLAPGTAPMTDDRDDVLVVLRHVPANVCGQCGEVYFDGEVVELAHAQMAALRQASTGVSVAEYALPVAK